MSDLIPAGYRRAEYGDIILNGKPVDVPLLVARLENTERENARLREALEKIERDEVCSCLTEYCLGTCASGIARQALARGGDG